jgi:predicted transposase YdaD
MVSFGDLISYSSLMLDASYNKFNSQAPSYDVYRRPEKWLYQKEHRPRTLPKHVVLFPKRESFKLAFLDFRLVFSCIRTPFNDWNRIIIYTRYGPDQSPLIWWQT